MDELIKCATEEFRAVFAKDFPLRAMKHTDDSGYISTQMSNEKRSVTMYPYLDEGEVKWHIVLTTKNSGGQSYVREIMTSTEALYMLSMVTGSLCNSYAKIQEQEDKKVVVKSVGMDVDDE